MDPELFKLVYEGVVNRATTYDGIYYTAVKTTKIVCRPTCRAKTPLASNVVFYRSLEEAIRAGYRPCKRCRPHENGPLRPDAALAKCVDALIEARYGEKLTLTRLAASLAMSPYHLQRVYKKVRGFSPQESIEQTRLKHTRERLLATDDPVAEIGESVGFGSPSYFTYWFCKKTGISPSEFRAINKGGTSNERR
ncbi:bifunctional transcriptional activator/DNA repair enzyme AdaA [Cohnella cellulosilytica]|uniref:Bifunctional transcriptional activator/DNA repair enzyme AdaA n=2 Tax=Cohnella cellulosilytica TaxID=986710 RepID=A0ABW2FCX1_9BACL